MKTSQLFTKTTKNIPAGEVSKNAQLLIRAGYIYKEMAGVYVYLPLGLRVLENIKQVIREEMNKIGGEEVALSALQNRELWEKSGRWDDEVVDVWFKTHLKNGEELGLAFTHEEPLTSLMKNYISSYKDLPCYPYQFQIKYRNELRAKSGLMRGREFWMKDLYSYSKDEAEHQEFYEKIAETYMVIFARLGLGDITYKTFASGGSFSKYSHEFQTITDAGEDIIYVSKDKKLAINKEVLNDEVLQDLGLTRDELIEEKASEVGNIFTLGTRFSDALDLSYTTEDNKKAPVFMGSYGIGPSRLMGLIAEIFADEKGLVWPENIAPFANYLITHGDTIDAADAFYAAHPEDTLYDDRASVSLGEKLKDAELLGIPKIIIISDRSIASGGAEVIDRQTGESKIVSLGEL